MPDWSVDTEREKAWLQARQSAYQRWREAKLAAAVDWLRKAGGFEERTRRLLRLERKFSVEFAEDVRRAYYSEHR